MGVLCCIDVVVFFFSSRRRHTRCSRDWSSDVCSSDLFVRRQCADLFFSQSPALSGSAGRLGRPRSSSPERGAESRRDAKRREHHRNATKGETYIHSITSPNLGALFLV